jgi:hypothetical protein
MNSERTANKGSSHKFLAREAKSSCLSPHFKKSVFNKKCPAKLNLKESKSSKGRWKAKKDQSKSINIQININDLHDKQISSFQQSIPTFDSKDLVEAKKSGTLIGQTNNMSSSMSMKNTDSSWFFKDRSKMRQSGNHQPFSKKVPVFGIKRSKGLKAEFQHKHNIGSKKEASRSELLKMKLKEGLNSSTANKSLFNR